MYQKYYSEFLKGHAGKIHMACHSHHFWPDIAKEGHMESYSRAVNTSDNKWEYAFETLLPNVQSIISKLINFSRPKDIAFAPNTHDLISKVFSCFLYKKQVKVLTSSCEFHSLNRQIQRLNEEDNFEIHYIDPESADFSSQIDNALADHDFDIISLSHVFYNSGLVLENHLIEKIIQKKGKSIFLLDAYHGFCAIPTDISQYENDIYYIAGGYKYAQAGEGMCFMTLPKNCNLRPLFTGWFASFETLEIKANQEVDYDNSGMRFWGSTIDLTAFYRFRSVWDHFFKENLDVGKFDNYIKSLQTQFINNNFLLKFLVNTDLTKQGHFLTFKLKDTNQTKKIHNALALGNILTDFRGDRLRFGFSPYLVQEDIESAKIVLKSIDLLDY